MSYIKTWVERCDEHPDHQSGMVSNGMIQARMQEEIDDLRAEIERLREEIDTATREREEARAEVERLRKVYVLIATESAGIVEGGSIFEDKIAGCYASHQSADKAGENLGYVNWRIEEHKIIGKALEGKP